MILRLSNSVQRGILVVAAFALAISLSYFGIRNARAFHFAGLGTIEGIEQATHREPGDARNWYLLGRYWLYNLENPDALRAIRAFLSALALNPRSADIWLD